MPPTSRSFIATNAGYVTDFYDHSNSYRSLTKVSRCFRHLVDWEGLGESGEPACDRGGTCVVGFKLGASTTIELVENPSLMEPRTSGADRFNGGFMTGRSVVILSYLESTGHAEDWTVESMQSAFNDAIAGLYWWCETAWEQRASLLTFVVVDDIVPTDYEPIQTEWAPRGDWVPPCFIDWHYEWTPDVLEHYGYSHEWDGVFQHCNDMRSQYEARWAFELCCVRAQNDPDHAFEGSNNSGYAASYYEIRPDPFPCTMARTEDAPWTVVAFWDESTTRDNVVAHEVGHVYGAMDEYSESNCSCNEKGGYFHVPNANCQVCAINGENCMMRAKTFERACASTRGQIGWRDLDGDSIPDAIKPNSGRFAYIGESSSTPAVNAGDLIRIFTVGTGAPVTSIAVTEDEMYDVFTIWDGLNRNADPVVPGAYIYTVNGGQQYTCYVVQEDPVAPVITDVNYDPIGEELTWRVPYSFTRQRVFFYDSAGELVCWPIWDVLTSRDTQTLDLWWLPEDDYTVTIQAYRTGGTSAEPVVHAFTNVCPWLVGDANGNGQYSITDMVYIINYIFGGGPPPTPHPTGSGDADCNGHVAMTDAVYIQDYIFGSGPEPGSNCVCWDYLGE